MTAQTTVHSTFQYACPPSQTEIILPEPLLLSLWCNYCRWIAVDFVVFAYDHHDYEEDDDIDVVVFIVDVVALRSSSTARAS